MIEPTADLPDTAAARRMLDRSQQAARFLDLTRQRGLAPDDDDDLAPPLAATRLHELVNASAEADELDPDVLDANGLDTDGAAPGDAAADDDDDIRIDRAAFSAFRPGTVPRGEGLGAFTLDDDGDVFGDGNGFAADAPFGAPPDDAPF